MTINIPTPAPPPAETQAPRVLSATVNAAGTQLTVFYSRTVTSSNFATGFSATADGAAVALSAPSHSGRTTTYTIAQVYEGQGVCLTYNAGAGDVAGGGLDLASFTDLAGNNTSAVDEIQAAIAAKQATLVSGTNIKRINGSSLLGSGDLVIGLQQFTEARVTTAPHAAIPLHTLTATGAEANIAVAILPKGSGSLQLRTDSIKRGDYSVDLQIAGAGSGYAATGTYCAIGGGASNRAQASYSTVAGGYNNNAGGNYTTVAGGHTNAVASSYSFVGGGYNNQANADYSAVVAGSGNLAGSSRAFVGAGLSNTASGANSFVGAGNTNLASGQESAVAGGANNTASGIRSFVGAGRNNNVSAGYASILCGEYHTISAASASAIAGTYAVSRANPGAAIIGSYYGQQLVKIFHGSTTSATPVELGDDFANPAQYIMADQLVSCVTLQIAATDNTDNYAAWVEFLVKRGANAAATSIIGSPVVRETKSAGAATWSVTVAADTTNGGVKLTANGEAAKTIRWLCTFAACERK